MTGAKTTITDTPVEAFLAGVEPVTRREEALAIDALFRRVTGEAPKMWGAAMIGYGSFITAIINFLILSFIIFLLVRYAKKVMAEFEEKQEEAPAGPTEIDLLKEIRDELRAARPDYAPEKGPMG